MAVFEVFDYQLDFMSGRQPDMSLPKPRVLSSSSTLKLLAPNFGNPQFIQEDPEFEIGEIDSFTAYKQFRIIKRWKPFGSKYEKLLVEDTGWELSFTGGKVDWKLAYLFYLNELALRGLNNANTPSADNTLESAGSLYNKPLFAIYHTIYHYDGTEETYIYKDITILEYGLETSPDNTEIPERMSAFSPYRVVGETTKEISDISKINDKMKKLISAVNQIKGS